MTLKLRCNSQMSQSPFNVDRENINPPKDNETTSSIKVLWIVPHSSWNKTITIYDLTDTVEVDTKHLDKIFDKCEKEAKIKISSGAPAKFVLNRPGLRTDYKVYDGAASRADPEVLADWDIARFNFATHVFKFPPSSVHSSHNVSLKKVTKTLRGEQFVKDSVPYMWKYDKIPFKNMTLVRAIGKQETPVAFYRTRFPTIRTGGAVVVDENEMDVLVAVLTTCGMLRRDRD